MRDLNRLLISYQKSNWKFPPFCCFSFFSHSNRERKFVVKLIFLLFLRLCCIERKRFLNWSSLKKASFANWFSKNPEISKLRIKLRGFTLKTCFTENFFFLKQKKMFLIKNIEDGWRWRYLSPWTDALHYNWWIKIPKNYIHM